VHPRHSRDTFSTAKFEAAGRTVADEAGRPARLGPQGRRIAAESGAAGRTGSSGMVGLLCPTACRYGPYSRFHVSPTKLSLK
jgi:hypothetical protein